MKLPHTPHEGTSAHYRDMAQRALEAAGRAVDEFIKVEYLKIARAYTGLADHAERRRGSAPPP